MQVSQKRKRIRRFNKKSPTPSASAHLVHRGEATRPTRNQVSWERRRIRRFNKPQPQAPAPLRGGQKISLKPARILRLPAPVIGAHSLDAVLRTPPDQLLGRGRIG